MDLNLLFRSQWSQLEPGAEHIFVSECLELLGNTAFTNLGIMLRTGNASMFQAMCSKAFECYEKALVHNKSQLEEDSSSTCENTFACLHMQGRVLVKRYLGTVYKSTERKHMRWNEESYGLPSTR